MSPGVRECESGSIACAKSGIEVGIELGKGFEVEVFKEGSSKAVAGRSNEVIERRR
jgi:hypothetical protein